MTYIKLALNNSLSSMNTMQKIFAEISKNIANAHTDDYTKKSYHQQSIYVGNIGVGVEIGKITRAFDEKIAAEFRKSSSEVKSLEIQDKYQERIQLFFGQIDQESNITGLLTNFTNTLKMVSQDTSNPTLRQQVLKAGQKIAAHFNKATKEIQGLRREADQLIYETINALNQQLNRVEKLNTQISNHVKAGRETLHLEDQRDAAIRQVAEFIDIRVLDREHGLKEISTSDGHILTDHDAYNLDYDPITFVDASTTYPNTLPPIELNGVDITQAIHGGRLHGYLQMRDTYLTNLQEELNALAYHIRDEVNQIHNRGTAFLPSQALTANRVTPGATLIEGSGIIRIALIDDDANFADYLDLDLENDLPNDPTIDDLIDAINDEIPGLVSLNADDQLEFTAPGDLRVGFVSLPPSSATITVGALTAEFSHFFGFNDFFVSADNLVGDPIPDKMGEMIAVRPDLLSDPSRLSLGKVRSIETPQIPPNGMPVERIALSEDDNSIAIELDRLLVSIPIAFAAHGNLTPITTTLFDYGKQIISHNAILAHNIRIEANFSQKLNFDTKERFLQVIGVNIEEELTELVTFQHNFNASAFVNKKIGEILEEITRMV